MEYTTATQRPIIDELLRRLEEIRKEKQILMNEHENAKSKMKQLTEKMEALVKQHSEELQRRDATHLEHLEQMRALLESQERQTQELIQQKEKADQQNRIYEENIEKMRLQTTKELMDMKEAFDRDKEELMAKVTSYCTTLKQQYEKNISDLNASTEKVAEENQQQMTLLCQQYDDRICELTAAAKKIADDSEEKIQRLSQEVEMLQEESQRSFAEHQLEVEDLESRLDDKTADLQEVKDGFQTRVRHFLQTQLNLKLEKTIEDTNAAHKCEINNFLAASNSELDKLRCKLQAKDEELARANERFENRPPRQEDLEQINELKRKNQETEKKINDVMAQFRHLRTLAQDDSADNKQCPVCFDRDKDTVLLPCGHPFCNVCSIHLMENNKACPLCRKKIDKISCVNN